MGRRADLAGRTFGLLTAVRPSAVRRPGGGVIWHCLCACGGTKDVPTGSLMNGGTRSCGCRRRGPLPRKLTPARRAAPAPPHPTRAAVLALRAQGVPTTEIARRVGVSKQRVLQLSPSPHPPGRPRRKNEDPEGDGR
jgi:hypothetical protein